MTTPGRSKWCTECKRLIGVGCACGLSFKDKIKTIKIDKNSLTVDDQMWRTYDEKTGADKARREWGKKVLDGGRRDKQR